MKIIKMDLFPVSFPLAIPFTTALHSVNVKRCLLVRLESDEGFSGWGEAAPEVEITGDDAETAYMTADEDLRSIIVGRDMKGDDEFREVLTLLEHFVNKSSTAVAAVDIALHDLWCRGSGMPVYRYYGGINKPLKTSISIGILETRILLDRIDSILESGGNRIKLKIGKSKKGDYELLAAVRARFGDKITLSLDANQGYSVDDALELFNKIHKFDIEYIEQPVPAADLAGLKRLYRESPIPVMADEAVCTLDNLISIIENDVCDRVNLKLMKSGGLFQVNRFIHLCSENNIKCQLGCMIETPIGIAAGVHLGMQNKSVLWTDLDGHLFLENIVNCITGLDTVGDLNALSNDNGLGLDVDMELLSGFLNRQS